MAMMTESERGEVVAAEQPAVVSHGTQEETPSQTVTKPKRARGLIAIGIFKLSKAAFFLALGLGALHLVHVNIGELFLKIAATLHFDPEGQFVGMLEDKLDLVSNHQLRQMSLLSVGYGLLSTVEGIGLMMAQTWAEYLTLILTILALPIELFEICRHPTISRFGVMVINLLVLGYLLWYLKRKRKADAAAATEFVSA